MQLALSQNYQGSPQGGKPLKPALGTSNGRGQPQLVPKKMIEHYSYVLSDQIGAGYSSKVFKGKNEKTGDLVAVKVTGVIYSMVNQVIDMKMVQNEVEKKLLAQEIHALGLMSSPNVLKMYDCFTTQNNTYIVTEHCNQADQIQIGDLAKLLKKMGTLPELEAVKIMKHIMIGFKEQIRKRVIHRDLKPSNIFLKSNIPKIADYGFSKMMDEPKEKFYYNVGTPFYMCPQSLMQNKYSEKSDIWSLGVIFYELLYGTVPWNAQNERDLPLTIMQKPLYFNPSISVSEEAKNLIRECLTIDEDHRITLKEMEKHPLFARRNTIAATPHPHYFENEKRAGQQAIRSLSNHAKERVLQSPQRGQTAYAKLQTKGINNGPSLLSKKHIAKNQENFMIEEEDLDGGLPKKVISDEAIQRNDEIITCQLHFVKFVFRIARLLDHFNVFQTECMKEKLLFFILKNVMIKLTKVNEYSFLPCQLKDLVERMTNSLHLPEFSAYTQAQTLSTFKPEIQENYTRFKDIYQQLCNQIESKPFLKSNLIRDNKFASQYDQSFFELEHFYNLLQTLLKQAIKELDSILFFSLKSFSDSESLQQEVEAQIVLLDYLVIYYQLCEITLQNFEDPVSFTQKAQLRQITEGRPLNLEKEHFNKIHSRINDLKL